MTTRSLGAVPKPLNSDDSGAAIYQALSQLEQSQWWPIEKMQANQFVELARLLQHARQHSSYYGDILSGIDIATLNPKSYLKLPLLTRDTLQRENLTLDCRVLPAGHGSKKETRSSGSTGTPVTVRNSGLDTLMWNALLMREHLWHARDAGLDTAAIRWHTDPVGMAPEGIEYSTWGEPIDQFFNSGRSYYLNSASAVTEQAHWLLRHPASYLITHPSNLLALLIYDEQHDAGVSLFNGLKQIRTVGETVSEELRERVAALNGTRLIDFYSTQEIGYLALQCPEGDHYHIQSEHVYLEVLREDGEACEIGEMGRIVITALRNYATPLIRYEIGDFGILGPPCRCGRGLPVLKRVTGRVRNMMKLLDGSLKWPNFGFGKFIHIAPIRQFQIVQTSLRQLEFRMLVDQPLSSMQQQQLKQTLRSHLGEYFVIQLQECDSLKRAASGKFEDFICAC